MRLGNKDKELLRSWEFEDRDFRQIEEALRGDKTTYMLDDRRICHERAIELLGMRDFLSGIARSAFHWSAARGTTGGRVIYFDSRKLFK